MKSFQTSLFALLLWIGMGSNAQAGTCICPIWDQFVPMSVTSDDCSGNQNSCPANGSCSGTWYENQEAVQQGFLSIGSIRCQYVFTPPEQSLEEEIEEELEEIEAYED